MGTHNWNELKWVDSDMKNRRIACPCCGHLGEVTGNPVLQNNTVFYRVKCYKKNCSLYDKFFRVLCYERFYALREDFEEEE